MIVVLAQSGNIGSWFHLLVPLAAVLVGLLGQTIRKIREQNAKRAAELATERRRDETLRTGRDETGAFVGMFKRSNASAPIPAPSGPSMLGTADEARRKLQQLAEQRRKELAQMMRQAQQGRPGSQQRPGAQPPRRDVPPIIATAPAPARPVSPGMPILQSARQPAESEVRRKRDEQANKKAAQQAAARRKAQESQRPQFAQPVPSAPPSRFGSPSASASDPPAAGGPSLEQSAAAAYAIAQPQRSQASTAKPVNTDRMAAALDRIGGPAGSTAAISAWRRAIVLGELMQSPISMRDQAAV